MSPKSSNPAIDDLAAARVVAVATVMGADLTELARALHGELVESIPELRGDPTIVELLLASAESNVETYLHITQHGIDVEEVNAPTAAVEYARRLAQRGTSSNALLRAYRLGQRRIMDLAFVETSRQEDDGHVAFLAARLFQQTMSSYVDRVSEQVVAEYEAERERWLANRNTVRAAMLATILRGDEVDIASAESALGHRLRQNHLGVVAWEAGRSSSTSELRRLEALVAAIGENLGAGGPPLFMPQDRSLGWAWIPLGRSATEIDLSRLHDLVTKAGPTLRIALGTPGPAASGFRTSHLQAMRAQRVASIAGDRARAVTTYGDPGVRAAALLAGDPENTRDLVVSSLGGLAADDEAIGRLRETLLAFLSEKGSYLATAQRIHVHKNTVKYRVDKAIEVRGRPLDDDRLNLELGLVACQWLGQSVLSR